MIPEEERQRFSNLDEPNRALLPQGILDAFRCLRGSVHCTVALKAWSS